MAGFFVRIDRAVAGPFTGIELREAALAGIIRHDAVIGGSTEGPWFKAADVGLFSDKQTPLPHPAGTIVPQYQARGMPGAFQGPFKLRELIGFAARGMLPGDALLQSNRSSEWIPVRRIRVLSACLDGELVLLDDDGKVVLRTASTDSRAVDATHTRAPIEVAKSVRQDDVTTVASKISRDRDDASDARWTNPPPSEEPEEKAPSRLSLAWARLRSVDWVPSVVRTSLRPRLAMQLACVMLLFAGAASAYSYWNQIALDPEQVIGNWIGVTPESSEHPPFGLSLRSDGRCVIFNTTGDCWTGDYIWEDRIIDQSGFASMSPFSTQFDQASPQHQVDKVLPTDGYIRLQGFVKDPPVIDGHPVRDLFVRREGEQLRVGYITSVSWTPESKTVEAGWMETVESPTVTRDMATELRGLDKDLRAPTELFGGASPLHLSEAIDAVRLGIPSPHSSSEAPLHECLTFSSTVTAGYLLANYGLPDEARRIYRFEIPKLRGGPSFHGAQIVRYGELKFVFSPRGELLYLALVPSI